MCVVTIIRRSLQSTTHTERTTQKAIQGHQVVLRCPLHTGSLTVQWQKDRFGLGFDPQLSSFPRYSYDQSQAGCDLVIKEVDIKDGGLFTCTAVYPGQGMTVVSSVELVVMVGVSQPQILQDNPVTLVEGHTVVLKCMSQGKPAPDLSWQHEDGSEVEAVVNTSSVRLGRSLFRTESHLTLTAERSQQFSQKIFCSAQNFVEKKSSSVTLIVHHKPQLELTQLNDQGEILQFRCTVKSRPRAGSVTWHLNTRPLSPDLISADTLSLKAAPELVGATIACNASNYLGSQARDLRVRFGEHRAAPDVQPAELLAKNKLSLRSDLYDETDREQREQRDGALPLLATVAIIVLASLVTLLLTVLSVIVYYKYQKRKLTQPLKAINRYGERNMLNNEEKLLQDLMFTKHKGVNDIRAVEAQYQTVPNNFNLEPPIKPVQLSPRSSLRSFFPDFAGQETGEESVVGSSVVDSGVSCGVARLQEEEETVRVETSV